MGFRDVESRDSRGAETSHGVKRKVRGGAALADLQNRRISYSGGHLKRYVADVNKKFQTVGGGMDIQQRDYVGGSLETSY